MNELIRIENVENELRVDSRLISEKLGVSHKATIQMIGKYQGKLEKYGKVPFQMLPLENSATYQKEKVCFLNEQQSTFLVTLSKNSEKAVELKQELNDGFHYYKNQVEKPKTALEYAKLFIESEEKRLILHDKVEKMKPKEEFYDSVANADKGQSFDEIARVLGIGRNKLYKRLRAEMILKKGNLSYQKYIDQGYFVTVEIAFKRCGANMEAIDATSTKTLVTGKGLQWIQKKFFGGQLVVA